MRKGGPGGSIGGGAWACAGVEIHSSAEWLTGAAA
jgi:hypothetical protein